MTRSPNRQELLDALRSADGPSRELDLAVQNFFLEEEWRFAGRCQTGITTDRYGPDAVGNPLCTLEPLTASLDAALGLVGEVLNEFSWGRSLLEGEMAIYREDTRSLFHGVHESPAIALLIALLSAIEGE